MQEREPKIALFDLDGSLADFHQTLLNDLQKIQGPNDPPLDYNLWSMEKYPYMKQRMHLIKHYPGWWKNLPTIGDGFLILKLAKQMGFENHILTKGPKVNSTAWKEKVEWCAEYVGDLADSVHIVSKKGLVYGAMLYDDFPDYMLDWLKHRPRGLGIMPETPYNKDFEHPNVIKWTGNNYEEVKRAMKIAYDRENKHALVLT